MLKLATVILLVLAIAEALAIFDKDRAISKLRYLLQNSQIDNSYFRDLADYYKTQAEGDRDLMYKWRNHYMELSNILGKTEITPGE